MRNRDQHDLSRPLSEPGLWPNWTESLARRKLLLMVTELCRLLTQLPHTIRMIVLGLTPLNPRFLLIATAAVLASAMILPIGLAIVMLSTAAVVTGGTLALGAKKLLAASQPAAVVSDSAARR